jgi:AAA+ ATPase superfamily predicted ATPase
MEAFSWPLVDEFLDRKTELERLNAWWDSAERRPVALIGRRRAGKSWLFRRFAHGKPAVLLVAEQLPPGVQLTRFAEVLEPVLGVRPDLPDIGSLFQVVFRAARDSKLLVVIDEFPWLLGTTSAGVRRKLTKIQAIMEEERDRSKIKLVLCGSHVGQMDALFSEQNPMHGRLVRSDVRPLRFADAAVFFAHLDNVQAFERYAIAGGMPLYLGRLATGTVRGAVCREILDRNGPLWNEGRSILEQELKEPRVYFGILEQLAGGEKELNEIAQPMRMDGPVVAKYLSTLVGLRLVERRLPFGAAVTARGGHWRLVDPFLRFWFRFVFPFQSDLETGLRPEVLYDGEVAPALADHVAPVFEEWCRAWLRRNRGHVATKIGNWWGNAANRFRRDKERNSEEIDAVGTLRNRVTLVAECKWTNRQLGPSILTDLETYKIPALADAGLRIADQPKIVLFSKSGYSTALHEIAARDGRVELVDVPAELAASISAARKAGG